MKRDLSALDRNIFQGLGRLIQEGFAGGFDCALISGGKISGGSDQGIYEESATQNFTIGSVMRLKDGREFVYTKNGAVDLGIAKMCQAPVPVTNYAEQVQTDYGWAIGASAGTILITTGATPTADAWKDGWMLVNKGDGLGQMYRIQSNTSHATLPYVTLYDEIVTAFSATSEVTILSNPNNGVVVVPKTTPTSQPVGVPLIAVTAAYYCWLQVKGPCPLIVDTGDTVVIGNEVGIPATNAVAGACGAVQPLFPPYGRVMHVGAEDEPAIVDLCLR